MNSIKIKGIEYLSSYKKNKNKTANITNAYTVPQYYKRNIIFTPILNISVIFSVILTLNGYIL